MGTALAAVALVAGACGDGAESEASHPLLEPSPTAEATGAAGDAAGEPDMASAEPTMPELCSDVIAFADVARALAVPVGGGIDRVYATDFHPDSGRLERLTCTYGTPLDDDDEEDEDGPSVVTINISSYVDADAATVRVAGTVDSARGRGNEVEAFGINGYDGFVLRSEESVSYVVAADDLTYVVTLLRGVVDEPAEQVVLVELSEAVLGAPSATPTPS